MIKYVDIKNHNNGNLINCYSTPNGEKDFYIEYFSRHDLVDRCMITAKQLEESIKMFSTKEGIEITFYC